MSIDLACNVQLECKSMKKKHSGFGKTSGTLGNERDWKDC